MAEECSDDDDAKAAINELRKAVLDKLKVYDSVVQVRSRTLLLLISFSSRPILSLLAVDLLYLIST